MAMYHASVFNNDGKIKHGWWGALYIGIATLFAILNHSIWLFLAALLIRKLFFDTTLNLSRSPQLRLFYISPEVKKVTGFFDALRKGKFNDWVHWKIFGTKPEIYAILYFLILIVLNIWIM